VQPLKSDILQAVVKNGRLVLDEPTDLPEGEVVELVLVDAHLNDGTDGLDDEERARLDESLRESIEQVRNGEAIDAAEALAELRAHR
jgi:predicted DNA-binding antitoxin AbrB/MazE fold protein